MQVKPIYKMTKKELENEYNAINWQIEESSYGRWELFYRVKLEREIEKRGYELHRKVDTFKLI